MSQVESVAPKHVGIILDGNRRWAKNQGVTTLEGHRRGAEVFKTISLAAFNRGVEFLSAYVFSTENSARSEEEVSYLMKLIVKAVEKYLDEFNNQNIRIVVIGNRSKLNKTVINAINQTEEKTKNNQRGTLALCLNYGGHQEIVDAIKNILSKNIDLNDVSAKIVEQNLYAPEIPPLDLLIRTSGEQRISGFMLWRMAYAELLFSEKLWPDYGVKDLDDALINYNKRQRRFGG